MADEIRIPINLEVTDLDLSQVDAKDIQDGLKGKLEGVEKAFTDLVKSVDTSTMTANMERSIKDLHKAFDGVKDVAGKFTKSLEDTSPVGLQKTEELAKELVSSFESLHKIYSTASNTRDLESPLTKEYKDRLDIMYKLQNVLKWYKAQSAEAAKDENTSAKTWQNIDANVQAVGTDLKDVLRSLTEMVRTGAAFKLGADTDENIANQLATIKSARGSRQTVVNSANYNVQTFGTRASQEIIQAKTAVQQLETELEIAKRKLADLQANPDAISSALIEASNQVNAFETALEQARAELDAMYYSASAPADGLYQTASAAYDAADATVGVASHMEEAAVSTGNLDEMMTKLLEAIEAIAITAKDIEVKIDTKPVEDVKDKVDETKQSASGLKDTLGAVKQAFIYIGISGSSTIGRLISAAMLLESAYRDTAAAANSIIPVVGIFVGVGMSLFGKLISIVKKLGQYLIQIGSTILDIAKSVGSTLLGAVAKLGSKLKDIISNLKPSGKLLKNLFQTLSKYFLGFRSTYFLIRKVRQVIIDGMKDIAAQSPEVNEVLSNFTTELNHLKGLLVAAFQPVLSFVLPVLTRLMAALARVLTLITKFLAVLTGQDYYYDYVATMQDYAKGIDAVGKAAKKAKRDLMGFDEINRLSDTDNGGSAGALPIGDWKKGILDMNEAINAFAEMVREAWKAGGQFTEVGMVVGNTISVLLDMINNELLYEVDAFLTKLTNAIATFINGFVSIEGLGEKIGTTFANILNTIIKAIDNFLTTVEWDKVGTFIGDMINGWFLGFDWSKFFTTIAHLFNSIFTFLYNAAQTVQWTEIGVKIASGLIDGLKEFDAETAGKACYEVVKGLLDMLLGWLDKMNEIDSETGKTGWQILGDKIKEFFENFKFNDVAKEAGECVGKLLGGLADAILEADPDGTTFTGAIDSFFEGLNSTDYKSKLEALWDNTIKPALLKFWEWLKPKLQKAASVIMQFLAEKIQEAFDIYKESFKSSLWESLTDSFKPTSENKGYSTYWDALAEKYGWGAKKVQEATDSVKESNQSMAESIEQTAETVAVTTESTAESVSQSADAIEQAHGVVKESAESVAVSVQESDDAITKSSEDTAKNVGGAYKSVQKNIEAPIKELPGSVQEEFDKINNSVLNTVKDNEVESKYSGFWSTISNVFTGAPDWFKDKFSTAYQFIQGAFSNIGSWATGIFDNIKGIFQSIPEWFSDKFSSAFTNVKAAFSTVGTWAVSIWNTIKEAFKVIPEWFKNTFSDAWENVKKVFSSGGQVFQGIQTGLFESMKRIINSLIDGLNAVIVKPFESLNNTLRGLKSVDILGVKPFSWIGTISVPRIPKLAKGAVLPPNSPFLSIVGDQKTGTNIEAPLETIKQAVAEIMADQYEGMVAGFEAVVNAIQNKDLNVNIGDKEIGQASNRYNQSEMLRRGYV